MSSSHPGIPLGTLQQYHPHFTKYSTVQLQDISKHHRDVDPKELPPLFSAGFYAGTRSADWTVKHNKLPPPLRMLTNS